MKTRLLAAAILAACAGAQERPQAPLAQGLLLPATSYNYSRPELPFFYIQPAVANLDNTPGFNLVTDEGATLGRVLFYDTALSRNHTRSCGSCHRAETGFADKAPLSQGFLGGETRRHSMGISNARYYRSGRFFWDERAASLEAQVLMPIQDGVEMGMTLDAVVERVSAAPYYPPLFQAAFGDPGVGGVTGQARDQGRFKVPSLRNVGLRAPYMHDGRIATLEQVIEHYDSGVQNHPNLDNPLRRNGGVRRLNLTDAEKRALVAFLHTLSDHELAGDPKFSDPFRFR